MLLGLSIWGTDAMAGETLTRELVTEQFLLGFATPSISFSSREAAESFHHEFNSRAGGGLKWLANRIQKALAACEHSTVELGEYRRDPPVVYAFRGPGEEGSLERAAPGPVRLVIVLDVEGQALLRVPRMTAVRLEVVLLNRPSREELDAFVARIEEAIAAP